MNLITERARQALLRRRESLRSPRPGEGLARMASGGADAALALRRELTEQEEHELREIDAALGRIDSGHFGRCEKCGGAIGRQRLRAIPEARLCISCSSGF